MLRKKERLNREAFSRFFALGTRLHSPFFQLIYTPHDTFHGAVVVSKKLVKGAVKRNKLRRRIYDMLRRYARTHNATGVYILIAKAPSLKASYKTLTGELEVLIRTTEKIR